MKPLHTSSQVTASDSRMVVRVMEISTPDGPVRRIVVEANAEMDTTEARWLRDKLDLAITLAEEQPAVATFVPCSSPRPGHDLCRCNHSGGFGHEGDHRGGGHVWPAVSEAGGYPAQVTVFCDGCGVEHDGDYLVRETDDQATRFGYARAHLRGQGWSCDERGDYCPKCVPAVSEDQPKPRVGALALAPDWDDKTNNVVIERVDANGCQVTNSQGQSWWVGMDRIEALADSEQVTR